MNESNSLHEEKIIKRNPSHKINENLNEMKSKLTAMDEVLSGKRMMNDE